MCTLPNDLLTLFGDRILYYTSKCMEENGLKKIFDLICLSWCGKPRELNVDDRKSYLR